jgi:hypothetical protein
MRPQPSSRKRKTRKVKKEHALSIPEIRNAFEILEKKTLAIQSMDKKDQKSEFRKTWKELFRSDIDLPDTAIEAYISIKHKKPRRSRTRKQHGGMAPIDSTLGPGVTGDHGSFLRYLSDGLMHPPEIARQLEWGVKDFTPHPLASVQNNTVHKGGGTSTGGSFFTNPGGPSTTYADLRTVIQGGELPPSGDPSLAIWRK